jgi:hypothetical protein
MVFKCHQGKGVNYMGQHTSDIRIHPVMANELQQMKSRVHLHSHQWLPFRVVHEVVLVLFSKLHLFSTCNELGTKEEQVHKQVIRADAANIYTSKSKAY